MLIFTWLSFQCAQTLSNVENREYARTFIPFHPRFIMWNLVRIRAEDRRWRPTRSRYGRPAVRAPRPQTGPAGPDRRSADLSDFPGGRSPRRTGRWGRGLKAAPTPRRRRTRVVRHRGGPTRPTRLLTDISRHPQIPSQVGCIALYKFTTQVRNATCE
jgi:hypothetical protein